MIDYLKEHTLLFYAWSCVRSGAGGGGGGGGGTSTSFVRECVATGLEN